MTRLKDIAIRAGVSVMTVSKALRDASDVSAATKARVKLLAQEMGYVPDSTAQGLRNRRTKLLGVAVASLTDPFLARALLAIEERAHEAGYDILVAQTRNNPDLEEACIRRFLWRRVDGLFVAPVYRLAAEARIYQELIERQVPTVLLGPSAPFCARFSHVECSDLAGSQAVTSHLLELGHRRIAFLAGPTANPWAQERFEGYRRALREAGIEIDDKLVFQAGRSIDDGVKAATQVLSEGCDATAVQAVNDLVAAGFARTLLGHGQVIPRDFSLTGFGNIQLAENFRVPLTTVDQPNYRLGVAAAELMQQLLRGGSPQSKSIPADLVIRASTGAPPARPALHQA